VYVGVHVFVINCDDNKIVLGNYCKGSGKLVMCVLHL
jgi:hypothetical protein